MAKASNMRGLSNFIAEIRDTKNREEETRRVEKELAKIRQKFGQDKVLTQYDQKKYVWKLLYIFMLGYDVEFGHKQATDLIPAPKYAEKQVGYVACSILLNETDEFLRLVINSIRVDLLSRNEVFQCLALSFIGSVGGQEMAESLTQEVQKTLTSNQSRPLVRKKAALALLRLHRKVPEDVQLIQPDTWSTSMAKLLQEKDLGLLLSAVTLLVGLIARNPAGYENCVGKVVSLLERIVSFGSQTVPENYHYYKIPVPWLQAKCLRGLQYFNPPEDPAIISTLTTMLRQILKAAHVESGGDAPKRKRNVNRENATNSILFEAISLCLHMDLDRELLMESVNILGRFLTGREPNPKYLALESLSRLALVPEVLEAVKLHQDTIVSSLRDLDVSIRRRAMDLLFTMCDVSNAGVIVKELLKYLPTAEFQLREELVLKMAILSERFAPSVQWYVDTTCEMMENAGDYISQDIWYRVVQLVTNNDSMQAYAAQNLFEALQRGSTHESLINVSAYVLGEYGHLISVPPHQQFQLLNERFALASPGCKALLLTSYTKLFLMDPYNQMFRQELLDVFGKYKKVADAELQQRSTEYEELIKIPEKSRQHFFQPIPKWPERESFLMRRLAQQVGDDDPSAASTDPDAAAQPTTTPVHMGMPPPSGPANEADLLGTGGEGDYAAARAAPSPHAAQAPVMGGGADLLDLLSDGNDAPPGVAQTAVASSAADPFAISGDVNALVGGDEIRVMGDTQQWYRNLLTNNKGIIYEDTWLQVGMKSEFKDSMASLVFFFGNKNQAAALDRVVFVVPPSPEFQIQMGPVPQTIQPNQQVQVHLQVLCLTPFSKVPSLQVGYLCDGAKVSQDLKLPLAPHKFIAPLPTIDKGTYFSNWKQYDTAPMKQAEMVSRETPVTTDGILQLFATFNMPTQHNYLDPTEHNDASAGQFVYGQPEALQRLLVQARVEANPNGRLQFKLTVACSNPMVTSFMKEVMGQHLKGML